MMGGRSVLALRAKVPGLDEATFARMASNHFGRYQLSERFVGYNEKWLATTCRKIYRWEWLR